MADGYSFRGERIDNGSIKSDNDLYKFLQNTNNSSFFLQVEKAVEAAKAVR